MAQITLDGTARAGVWSFGRSATNQSFALTHESIVASDYNSSQDTLKGFFFAGEYLFQSYTDNGTYKLTKTNNSASYSFTSVYETIINPDMDANERQTSKQLEAIAIKTEPLPTNGQIVVKYKVDSDSSWTTLLTHDTEGDVVKELRQALKTGRDFQYRLESTNGAAITSFRAKYEITDNQLKG